MFPFAEQNCCVLAKVAEVQAAATAASQPKPDPAQAAPAAASGDSAAAAATSGETAETEEKKEEVRLWRWVFIQRKFDKGRMFKGQNCQQLQECTSFFDDLTSSL